MALRLGMLGCGGRAQSLLGLMRRLTDDVQVTAVCDPQVDSVRAALKELGYNGEAACFYNNPDEMLDHEELDGVMVGTRCSLHASMGIKALQRNLPLYLEKPVATSMQDLMALRDAGEKSTSRVVVSFPLRVTPLVKKAGEIIQSGQIGTVEHVEAWNNVPYGWVYFMGWYRDEHETGGLFLQKATHDFDYINHLVQQKPVTVCAMTSKQVMKGSHPAGLSCDECPEQDTCLESPYHRYFTKCETPRVEPSGRQCAFAVDTGNEDSGSAIVRYESGMHLSYTQDFVSRKAAGNRGARFVGYLGTVEFDWYTDEVKVYMHHTPRVETCKMDSAAASHGGGDTVLLDSFLRLMRGGDTSVAPLSAGLTSVLMCLKAKESASTNTFQKIEFPDRPL